MDGLGFVRRAILLIGLLVMPLALPTIDFQSHMSTVQLQPTNAQLKLVNVAQVVGWSDRSIVKTFGHNVSSAWPEAYANATVISQSGGTKVPQTELVQANSSAIVVLNPAIRTTSNAVLYGLRVNSNALLYGDRITSNGIVLVRTNSNAFAFGNRTTSNAVTYSSVPMPIADSIDGTALPRYRTTHHVFHNNGNAWSVRGWVRFNDGFTVMPRASVIMDTLTTVSGAMDLRDTGTLILNNDLYLAHNVTLTNGGNIKGEASLTPGGQANTIFMGGDLTLASTTYARTLHITGDWSANGNSGDLVIDGCGHTLSIEDRAQIFVDQNMTLTLRNMTIKTGPKSLNNPAIQLASFNSKLALDNVVFDLGADFHFIRGQLFIHGEVAVTGTSSFVYQSPVPSYITSGATWSFEYGTTFSIAPSTYTDQLFTTGYATSNNFIVLADASSSLYLNDCSFKTTYTGARFTKGMVLFDNGVPIDTRAGVSLAATPITSVCSITAGSYSHVLSWSPDSRFIAVVNYNGNSLQVFRFTGSAGVPVGATVTTGTNPYSVAWSPDGRFLAVVNYGSVRLQVYRFTGNSTLTPVGGAVATASLPYSVCWSPDGKFLAVVNDTPSVALQVFRFNGVSAPVSMGTASESGGSNPVTVDWSPDGRFILIIDQVHEGTNAVQVFQFNGQSVPTVLGVANALSGAWACGGRWSPDGRFISLVNYAAHQIGFVGLQIFRFNGTSTITSVGTATVPAGYCSDSCWSPDGRFVGVVSANYFSLYSNNVTSNPIKLADISASTVTSAKWSPDGMYVATGSSGTTINVYSCNFVSTPVAQQGFGNSLVFGDKAKGSVYDADVRVLSGSVVTINGKVKDDSV